MHVYNESNHMQITSTADAKSRVITSDRPTVMLTSIRCLACTYVCMYACIYIMYTYMYAQRKY